MPDISAEGSIVNYKKALEKGLLKILSKMGISLLNCYHGAQVSAVARSWGAGGAAAGSSKSGRGAQTTGAWHATGRACE